MHLLTTLYVTDHRAKIGLRHASLTVVDGDGLKSRIPLEALEAVVIVGHAQVSTDALAACSERGVSVTSLAANGRVRYEVGRAIGGNVHLRVAQITSAMDPERANEISRWIVAAKLQNARRMLQRWWSDARGADRRFLEKTQAEVAERAAAVALAKTGDAIRGLEGDGTRIYFGGLRRHLAQVAPEFDFEARSRRPPRDPVNALLSFAYGLQLGPIAGALEAIGLDPQVGFLHRVRPGRPSLALDLLEEFRMSIADRFIVGLLARNVLTTHDFVRTLGGACYLGTEGRRRLLGVFEEFKASETTHLLLRRPVARGSLPTVQATLMARFLRGDLPAYPPYVMDA